MKTNKERAKIILDRYSGNDIERDSSIKGNEKYAKSKGKFWTWKRITALSCLAVIVVSIIGGLLYWFAGNDYGIDKMYIANYSSYVGLGSGYINENSKEEVNTSKNTRLVNKDVLTNNKNLMLASSSGVNDFSKNYLLGQKPNGTMEKLAFSKTKYGKPEALQKGIISSTISFTDFTFFQWNNRNYNIGSDYIDREMFYNIRDNPIEKEYKKVFVIDHKSGKIFDLSKIDNAKVVATSYSYGKYSLESDDCMYIWLLGNGAAAYEYKLYKMYVENEELKLELVINIADLFYDYFSYFGKDNAFADKYGNVYICANGSDYIISNGKIKKLQVGVFKSINGIVYTNDWTQKINENGEIVENTFTNCKVNVYRENLIKVEDNVSYYYGRPYGNNLLGNLDYIYKLTWQNEEEFTYETIKLEQHCDQYVVTQDKIYFCSDTEVYSIDIKTGKKENLVSNYIFNKIQTDYMGNVLFTALDKNLNSVNGILYSNGEIVILTTPRKYVVYSLKAIN